MEPILLKEDTLSPILWLPSRLVLFKPLRLYSIFALITTIIGSIGCIFSILMTRSIAFCIQYSFSMVGTVYGTITLVTLFLYHEQFDSMIAGTIPTFWDVSNGNNFIRARIRKESKIAVLIMILNILLSVGSGLLFIPFIGDEKQIFFFLYIAESILPMFGVYIVWVFSYIVLLHLCISMISQAYIIMYVVLHVKFQIYLMIDNLKNIGKFRRNDLKYQEKVRKSLIIIIKHHIEIKRFINAFSEISRGPIIYYGFTGAMFAVSSLYFLYSGISPSSNVRMIAVLLSIAITTVVFCTAGQALVNTSENIAYATYATPWSEWDLKNRKILLLLLVSSMKHLELSAAGIVALNYQLLIKFIKTIYSTIMFMINVTRK